jgi:uncharacterized membrane protein YdjX (TVP38/TMEM64 family)
MKQVTMSSRSPTATNAATANAATKAFKPALMAGAMIAVAFSLPLLGAASAQSTLQHLVMEGGVRGPALFLLLATFLTAIGLPRQVPAFVAGYAFGAWDGAAISLLSQVLACGIDFSWSRLMGRAFVYRRFGPALRKIDSTLAARPFIATLAFRLMPVGSNILLNLAAGLSSVRALPFITASAIGFIPQTVIFALIGRGSAPAHGYVLGIGIGMFVLSAICGVMLLRKYRQIAV